MKKEIKGITLISLVITVIIMLILTGVAISYFTEYGFIDKVGLAANETNKNVATEKINLKITTLQIKTYTEKQNKPTLQELANELCQDDEVEYVALGSKLGSLDKVNVGNASSIFTKLNAYPYEFEINSSLQLASIDGEKLISDKVEVDRAEFEALKTSVATLTQTVETLNDTVTQLEQKGTWKLLASTTSQTEVTLPVEDLRQFSSLVFVVYNYMFSIVESGPITYELLKNQQDKSFWLSYNGGTLFAGYVRYVSDFSVLMRCYNANAGKVELYGIY